jgi:hypothetical protein
MRKIALLATVILACAVTVDAATPRTLTRNVPVGPIEALELKSGIGDVKVIAREGLDEVAIEVTLTPRRGGFFSSKRQAEHDVQAASLRAKVEGKKLVLGIYPPADDERRFEERWTIELPANIELKLNHGVGDISIQGVRAGLEIDSGVGDIEAKVAEGDITIDLGVGTAVVIAPADAYASAEGAGGVGDARLTIRGEKISSGGFVSHAASWSGNGAHHIEVSVGVGDAVITLD